MGLFGFIKKGVKAVTSVTRHLPGPIGTASSIANRALRGRGPKAPMVNVQGGGGFAPPGIGPSPRTDLERIRDLGGLVFGGPATKAQSVFNIGADAGRALQQSLQPFGPIGQGSAAMAISAGGSLANLKDIPVIVAPATRQIQQAPPGYVLVTRHGVTAAILKPVARSMGLWKPRKKPPISVSEYTALQKAARAENKIKSLAKKADFVVRKSKR